LLTSLRFGGHWGDGLLLGLIASAIQAVLCYRIIGAIRRSRKKDPLELKIAEPLGTIPKDGSDVQTPLLAPQNEAL
jgi:hypothetical protein